VREMVEVLHLDNSSCIAWPTFEVSET